jgi:hypothetical protein
VVLAASEGNAANLMVGSGMQQARGTLGGASRQGGEKPRRRNVIGQVALLDRREPPGSWEWTPEVSVDGEAEVDESHERRGIPSAERWL